MRALSPGINDPHTAIAVIDQLSAAISCVLSTGRGYCDEDGTLRAMIGRNR